MKHSTTRRLLAFLLTAVMLASLLPALSLTAGARAPQKVNAASADELKSYLESSTDYDITLTKEIDKYIGSTEVWCTVHGTKRLNVNGFDILLHQDEGKVTSYLFRVAADANLTVYDGKNAGTVAKIHYHAKIVSGNLVGTLAKWRHLFDVYGKLTINNVKCTAGRVDSRWNYAKAQYVSVQTYGSAVMVHDGGYLEVNGGYLTGHTYPPKPHDTPVIDTADGSTVEFNFGEVHGYGQADCFKVNDNASVRVASGVFDSDYYSKVMWGTEYEAYQIDKPGWVGLMPHCFADGANPVTGADGSYYGAYTSVSPRSAKCELEAASGDSSVTNGVTHFRLLNSNPVLKVKAFDPYFHTAVDDSPFAAHCYTCRWQIYDGAVLVAESPLYQEIKDLNVMTAFSDFTPELSKEYRVSCRVIEYVKPNQYGVSSVLNDSDYYFRVTNTLTAPVITTDLPSSKPFRVGGSVTLSITASGSNLSYQWYSTEKRAILNHLRPKALTGQTSRTLNLTNLKQSDSGTYYLCVVSNSAGSVQSGYCVLTQEKTVISEIPILNLDQPSHGVPLDTSVDIDVPGLTLVSASWVTMNESITFVPLSDAEINNPVAGQTPILCVVVDYDSTVVIDPDVKVTALGKSSDRSPDRSGNRLTFYINTINVEAGETRTIDSVSLSFYNKGLELGEKAPSLYQKNCGFPQLGFAGLVVADVRYSIQSQKWYVDGVEKANPTVENGHTYTLKAELSSGEYWKFSYDTAVLVDGEETPITSCLTNIVTGATTAAIELEFSTKEPASAEEYKIYDLVVDGDRVTSGNQADILGNGLFSFDGDKTLTVKGSYQASNDVIDNLGVEGLVIRVEKDSVLSTGEHNQPLAIEADTTITGPGRLTLSGDSGIYVRSDDSTLTLRELVLDIRGNWGVAGKYEANSLKLVVERSNVKAECNYGAFCDFGGGITLTDCEIVQPQGGEVDGDRIVDADGKLATSAQLKSTVILNPFVDVREGAYYYEAVLWALNHDPQITNGTDPTHFSPDKTCTRAQVVTFLWRAMGCPEPTRTVNPFTDVEPDQYYYKAVLWAVEKNITNGTSPTTFSPDKGCTRAQVVTFLWRAEGQPEPTSAANPFLDVAEGQYYYKAVLWAVEKNITKGTSADKFSPDSTCTRGQIVTFLYRDMA